MLARSTSASAEHIRLSMEVSIRTFRSLLACGLFLAVASLVPVPGQTDATSALAFVTTAPAMAQMLPCNKCHYCPVSQGFGRVISELGVSTIEIRSEPSVARFVDTRAEHMRYVQGRDMVVFLSECDGSVALAFPARESERALLRERLDPHVRSGD